MDFIERIFGVSPDGGSGAFEVFLIALPLVLLAAILYCRKANRIRH